MGIAVPVAAFFIFSSMAKRVTVYIDGFNFYYGLRTAKQVNAKWYKGYWIDLVKFFGQFVGEGQELIFHRLTTQQGEKQTSKCFPQCQSVA